VPTWASQKVEVSECVLYFFDLLTRWSLICSENVKDESAANRGAFTGCEFGTNIWHRLIARRYPGARVRTDKSCRGPTCEGRKRSMVCEWDILICRAEGLNDVDLMGNNDQTLCYFCIIILSSPFRESIMSRRIIRWKQMRSQHAILLYSRRKTIKYHCVWLQCAVVVVSGRALLCEASIKLFCFVSGCRDSFDR